MKPLSALKIIGLSMVLTAILLLAWIGLVYAANVYTPVAISAEAMLNLMLSALLAFIGLPILHAAFYRHFWNIRRKLASGEMRVGDNIPAFGAEKTPPPPRIRKTPRQMALYAAFYIIGIASLIALYAPIGHQEGLIAFISRFSAGRNSFASLANLIIIFVPMAITLALIFPFLDADRKLIKAGSTDAEEILRLQDRQEWLFAFTTAYVCVGFLSFVAGNWILAFLA